MKKFKNLTAAAITAALIMGNAAYASGTNATRGEVADMLMNAADFYNPSVQKSDIIKGYEDGNLHEELDVTRAEALVMLSRAFGTLPEITGHNQRVAIPKDSFTDVPDWADKELDGVFNSGIVAGTQPGAFSPDEMVTKDQMELFIKRVYSLYGTNEKDDFYATVNKDILNKLELKPGRIIAGTLFDLNDESNEKVSEIIDEIIKNDSYANGTTEQKISDFYRNISDTESRNKIGIEPIKKYLDLIDSAKTLDDLENVQSELFENLFCLPYSGFSLAIDLKDSTKYMLYFGTMSPGMTKDFYAKGDKKDPYIKYLTTLLTLGGENSEEAAIHAESFYKLEKTLSEKAMNPEEYGDVDKIYNPYTMDQIKEMFKNMDIDKVFKLSGLKPEEKILITDTELVKEFAAQFNEENVDVLKTTAKLTVLMGYGGALNEEFKKAAETFNQEYLGTSGTYSDKERAALTVQSVMPEYIGKIYAEKYFDDESKQNVKKMVNDIISIYKERIDKLEWMSSVTKERAKKKLDTMTVKIGYPDNWDTYLDKVEIKSAADGGSYFKNMIDIAGAQLDELKGYQGTTVDKTEWEMYTFTVNACYSATSNDITFPAGILHTPMYDKNASYEENLGGIGYIIAHEITHAFDNNGAKFDENGNAAEWWTPEDYKAFQELCEKVTSFYDGQEGIPGIPMNGKMTLSENVADLGAASCVTEIVSGLENPDFKTLYTAMAKSWASTKTRDYAAYAIGADVHSDEKLRVNRVLVNLDQFYTAFDINEGDGMYVAPENRVKIW